MAEVFILLGGNVGDKAKIFEETRKLIGERIGLITKMSSVYATESWGFKSDLFWNQVLVLESRLNPFKILTLTQSIETVIGRSKKHYPTMDLAIMKTGLSILTSFFMTIYS